MVPALRKPRALELSDKAMDMDTTRTSQKGAKVTSRERAEELVKRWAYGGADDVTDIMEAINAAIVEERAACALLASQFATKADARIHPDIAFNAMNDSARIASHTTAQQIACAIRGRGDDPV